eukprot:Gb_23738 [translate_table: standard]
MKFSQQKLPMMCNLVMCNYQGGSSRSPLPDNEGMVKITRHHGKPHKELIAQQGCAWPKAKVNQISKFADVVGRLDPRGLADLKGPLSTTQAMTTRPTNVDNKFSFLLPSFLSSSSFGTKYPEICWLQHSVGDEWNKQRLQKKTANLGMQPRIQLGTIEVLAKLTLDEAIFAKLRANGCCAISPDIFPTECLDDKLVRSMHANMAATFQLSIGCCLHPPHLSSPTCGHYTSPLHIDTTLSVDATGVYINTDMNMDVAHACVDATSDLLLLLWLDASTLVMTCCNQHQLHHSLVGLK